MFFIHVSVVKSAKLLRLELILPLLATFLVQSEVWHTLSLRALFTRLYPLAPY